MLTSVLICATRLFGKNLSDLVAKGLPPTLIAFVIYSYVDDATTYNFEIDMGGLRFCPCCPLV